jgi:mannose-6-phosphate isomerase-like protein (cupin superfamily)
MPNTRYVFDTKQTRRYRFPTHTNELVVDRADSTASEVFVVVLEPGEAPPMHKHDDTEQVFYITEGEGRLEIGPRKESFGVKPGDVVRVPPSTLHRIHCTSATPLRYIAVDCFPGGRPTHEPTWDSHVRVICKEHGWEYEKVRK